MTTSINKRFSRLLIAPSLLIIIAFVLFPMVIIVFYSFRTDFGNRSSPDLTLRNWVEFFTDGFYFSILLDTVRLCAVTTLVCLLVGYVPAYYLSRLTSKWRWLLLLLLFLPSWIASMVRTMSWISVLGRNGVVNTTLMQLGLIEQPLPLLYNNFSVYIGVVHNVLPIMILNIFVGLQAVDRNLVDAARTLGASNWRAFVEVTWPLSLPSVMAGSLLCFIITAGAYVVPMLLGGVGSIYFPNLIYQSIIQQLDWPMGATLSTVFIVLIGSSIALYARFMGLSNIMRGAR